MPRKGKTATSNDLPSRVQSRQEQCLYFFTREEAIKSLQFTEVAFMKAAARLAKKGRILRIIERIFRDRTYGRPHLRHVGRVFRQGFP